MGDDEEEIKAVNIAEKSDEEEEEKHQESEKEGAGGMRHG